MIFNFIKSVYFISIITYFCERVSAQSGSCIKTYTDLAINGNDLNGVQGSSSSCCQLCQQKRGCLAYTWDNFNGGTCWLKSDTQPLYSKNGSISGLLLPDSTNTYSLNKTYSGPNFFDDWIFEGGGGNVADWVNESLARDLGIIGYQNNSVYIAVDYTNVIPNNSWWGRPTIRIQSKYLYNSGLFVLNMNHMPTGPGTWPAFWTYGPHWPNNGEIDILEGVYAMDYDQITLHVGEGCTMRQNDSQFFTGQYVDDKGSNGELKQVLDCYQYAKSNDSVHSGCSVMATKGTFNTDFNHAGGGVYAMQWEREKFIRTWIFVQPNIPTDIASGSLNPNPDTWGLPMTYFPLGSNCTPDHFTNHTIVISTALCGSWVDVYYPGGEAACNATVRNHPELYTEAYWSINYLKVFCKPNEPCGFYNGDKSACKKFKRNYLENYNNSEHAVKTKNAPFFMIFPNISFFHTIVNYWTDPLIDFFNEFHVENGLLELLITV